MLEKNVGEECRRAVLEERVAEKCWRGVLQRSVEKFLGKSVVEKPWGREVFENGKFEKKC